MDTNRQASFALRRLPTTFDGFDGRQNRLSGNDKAEEGDAPLFPPWNLRCMHSLRGHI